MKTVVFAKYSNDRADEFAICTEILKDENGKKSIRKRPVEKEGIHHVQGVYENYLKLKRQYQNVFGVAACQMEAQAAAFEFVKGTALSAILENYIEQGEKDRIEELVRDYCNRITSIEPKAIFHVTEEFRKVFGDATFEKEQSSAAEITDIDLIFENIMIDAESWKVIDYEWSFAFLIPEKFVIYRSILYWFLKQNVSQLFTWQELMELVSITEEEEEKFRKMEANFQKYVIGGKIPVRDMTEYLGTKAIPFSAVLHPETEAKDRMQVYYNSGKGFSEQNSYFIPHTDEGEMEEIRIPVSENEKEVRFDPSMGKCVVYIESIQDSNGKKTAIKWCNGRWLSKQSIFFEEEDPQILVEIEKGISYLEIKCMVAATTALITELSDVTRFYDYGKVKKTAEERKNEIEELNEQIAQYEEKQKQGIIRLEEQSRQIDEMRKLIMIREDELMYHKNGLWYRFKNKLRNWKNRILHRNR